MVILTEEEYRKGILSWNPESGGQLKTCTTSSREEERLWSEPLSNPVGSKVESPVNVLHHVRPIMGNSSSDRDELLPVFWERLNPIGAVQTEVWDSHDGSPVHFHLGEIPRFGTFHRIVIKVGDHLTWGEDTVIHTAEGRIRLITGAIEGQEIPPFDKISTEGHKIVLTRSPKGARERASVIISADGETGEISVQLTEGDTSFAKGYEGKFIEVLVSGHSPSDAEANAYSILGLIALCLGDQASGELVLSSTYHADRRQPQEGIEVIPVSGLMANELKARDFQALDNVFPVIFEKGELSQACRLALRWYEKGVRSTTNLDQFISFFVGIEAILNAYIDVYGPIPELLNRISKENKAKLKKILRGNIDESTYNAIFNSLGYATGKDRIVFYVAQEKLDDSIISLFTSLAGYRGDVLHSRKTEIPDDIVVASRGLLVNMLKRTLDLQSPVPWETLPQIGYLRRRYPFAEIGFTGSSG